MANLTTNENENFPANSGSFSNANACSQSPSLATNNTESFHISIPDDKDQSVSPIGDVLQVEKDFMDYLMSFPLNVPKIPKEILPERSEEVFKKTSGDSSVKVGLDHLDNLCKLMEQLSDLKETNMKLKRRVQYLEDIKTLHEIHKEMIGEKNTYTSGQSEDELQCMKSSDDSLDISDIEKSHELCRSKTAGHISECNPSKEQSDLCRSKTTNLLSEYKYERGHNSRSATTSKDRRERSKSVGHSKGKKRSSRWSKVKEVLGIEKTDDASVDVSNVGHIERSPNLKENKHVKSSKLSCSTSHSNILSSRSFSEAERKNNAVSMSVKKCDTLDATSTQYALENFEKEDMAKKSPKTPWGKMKTMIQIRRDNRHQKSESSSPRDVKLAIAKVPEPDYGKANSRRTQRTHYASPLDSNHKNEPIASEYEEQRIAPFNGYRHHKLSAGYFDQSSESKQKPNNKHNSRKISSPSNLESSEDYNKTTKLSESISQNPPVENYELKSHDNTKEKKSKQRPAPLEYQADPHQSEDIPRSPEQSPQTQRGWMCKVKDVLKGKRGEDGTMSLSAPSSPASPGANVIFDFELDKDSSCHRTSKTSGPLLTSPSATVSELLRELQQNLSDDFNRKMAEWERCRWEGVERKDSFGRKSNKTEKTSKGNYLVSKKDLTWLAKEQQKVDREIIRLSKEKQKFEKRSFRLKQLKEAMTDGEKKEVLVKTSAGEFRFEGISDDFTKKLYEWETKKGLNPELSTIALLDESLKLPPEVAVLASASNSTRTSPEPHKNCYQVSRASSEPDLFTQKDTGSSSATLRSKSGDTLLSTDLVEHLEESVQSRDAMLHSEDNYYSLLEENMYLLDQLKEKDEICNHLQNELDRLDDRTEKTNRTHQEELEKYRQKLWEIHMSRPRDLQGSLHLISELKSRIDQLQKCSEKLKSDRERLEESFRYHSDQQTSLADDLIRKIRELQVTGTSFGGNRNGCKRKLFKTMQCTSSGILKIQDLSTRLLQQARDVEKTLTERTRQVCHLRWELLHRDMSAVLLQAALHRVTCQGEPPTWDTRRTRFKNVKAWSVDTTTRRQSLDLMADDWLQDRLRQLSMTSYSDWGDVDVSPNDIMATAHELKKETLRLSLLSASDYVSDSEEKKSATCSADSEMADSDRCYDTGSALNSRSSSFSSGGLRGSHSDTRLYERQRARRESSSSMSCVEATSDSSSLHEYSGDRQILRRQLGGRSRWRSLDNMSSSCSSRSSIMDDEISKLHWRSARSSTRVESVNDDAASHRRIHPQKYEPFKETDEDQESRVKSLIDWGSQCLITPKPIHLTRISDTESEKNTSSPIPFYSRGPKYSTSCRVLPEPGCSGLTYQSTSDGSVESLGKYETAIRDDELTINDGCPHESQQPDVCFKSTADNYSKCEHDPPHLVDKQCTSDHSGSPNIFKYKYKGTKGFGRNPRVGYSNNDEYEKALLNLMHLSESDNAGEA